MILITKIEIQELPDMPIAKIAHFNENALTTYLEGAQISNELWQNTLKEELIHGQWFVRTDGTRICMGTSQQAQDVIGIQYRAWASQKEKYEELLNEMYLLRSNFDNLYKENQKLHDVNKQRMHILSKLKELKEKYNRLEKVTEEMLAIPGWKLIRDGFIKIGRGLFKHGQ